MKNALLAVLLVLSVCVSQAIIVETASLRNFLIGHESNCVYDNWVSHLAEGIAIDDYNLYAPYDIQTTGFGDFRVPNATDLIYWNSVMDLFTAADYDGAQALLTANTAPFQVVEFHDTDTGRTLYMIREVPNAAYTDDNDTAETYDDEIGAFTYGWGIFIYNPEGTKPVIVTTPHPCDDFPTPIMSLIAFDTWNAKYLLINGAGREVRWTNDGTYTNAKSLSDPTRYALHPFQIAYKKFADKVRDEFGWREWSCQIHAYDWNRHSGYTNCQISAGNPRTCPNLPIRDLSNWKHDLINYGSNVMIPENTIGIHRAVYLNDFYSVNYDTFPFTFSDGVNTYPVNNAVDMPAYTQNQQMLYTQLGTTDYDTYEPFFHVEMDELPESYEQVEHVYKWFYGWNEETQQWDMDHHFDHFTEYYTRWIDDMELALEDMFNMNDGQTPAAPTNLAVLNQSLVSITLFWQKTSDFDFDTYEVLYGTQPINLGGYQVFDRSNAAILASQACESVTVTGLDNTLQYYFRLRAKDKNGNTSDLSNEVNTILAPANIVSLQTHGLDNTVRVYWQVNGQNNNQGFSIYRKEGTGAYSQIDSYTTNPNLNNSAAFSFEWWDNNVTNGSFYTYKISSTNLNNVEFYYNYPASASPHAIHTLTIRNNSYTLADSVAFGMNPYASDGQDGYWDTTKGNPAATYVWNAFWEQYWGSSGTQLGREIKSEYNSDQAIKTWIMRVRSDQLETLSITASDNFDRNEKLYLLDGGNNTYFNLLSAPYQYTNTDANVRTMTLFWGNMQPKVFISTQPNKVYQGGSSMNFFWNYQYPFLIDHIELSIQNETDSLLVNALLPNNQYTYSWMVPQNVLDMQNCRLAVDVVAVDGVRTRFWSDFHFALVPYMILAYNEPGWKTRTNPWLTGDMTVNQVFGAGSLGFTDGFSGAWVESTDFDFGEPYWIYNQDVSFFSSINPLQSTEVSYPLVTGWNFIPNPHMCAYDIEDLRFAYNGNTYKYSELLAQQLLSRAVYVMRNNVLEPVTRVEPFEALLIKYYGSAAMVPMVNFLPFNSAPPIAPSAAEWEFKTNILQSGSSTSLVLGAHANASNGYDFALDLPIPPETPFAMPSAWFLLQNDPEALEQQLYCSYKPDFTAPNQIKTWTFYVHAPNTDPITLTFNQTNIPDGWQIKVNLNDEDFYIGSEESYTFTPLAPGDYWGYFRVSNYVVGNDDPVLPAISALRVYPNPFNPDVNIAFSLGKTAPVSVSIYNLRGQKVGTLQNGVLNAGDHTLTWNGKDNTGRSVASGVYFARIETNGKAQIIKIMLMK
jgi:hypothetical protein